MPDEETLIEDGFDDCLRRHESGASLLAASAGRLLVAALRQGHSCASLASLCDWHPEFKTASQVAQDLGQSSLVSVGGAEFRPIVLDDNRLYLHRYWEYEKLVAAEIRRRAALTLPLADEARFHRDLDSLFPDGSDKLQREAAHKAATRGLTIIAGGPGTGKTTTILRALALIAGQEPGGGPLNAALAAPTGKAANRMAESLRQGLSIPGADLTLRVKAQASTIHRLLGISEETTLPRRNRENPLPHRTVIIDETSMVDLPLMARLLDAVGADARLVLLGDANQLASVEVGSIFADILAATESDAALKECTVRLTRNYRFEQDSGVQRFCAALQQHDEKAGLDLLGSGAGDVALRQVSVEAQSPALAAEKVLLGYEETFACEGPEELLAKFARQRILCAVRGGRCGVERFNRHAELFLAGRGLIQPRETGPYQKEPVILTRNDHPLGVFNGDTAVLVAGPNMRGLDGCFLAAQGGVRRVPVLRLPPFLPGYAMTIHRSQGSEFDHVLVVLPPAPHRGLTRELLYTAVSRARKSVVIWGSPEAVRACFQTGAARASGLAERLA